MSADIKWEAVEYGGLKAGDKVRLLHGNGDVIHAVTSTERSNPTLFLDMDGPLTGWTLGAWTAKGYRFERAVPERTLPTEPGIYIHRDMATSDAYIDAVLLHLDADGKWSYGHNIEADVALRDAKSWNDKGVLVRLVPVTEVEELRQRIEKADEYLAAQHREAEIGDVRPTLTSLLYGEAIDV